MEQWDANAEYDLIVPEGTERVKVYQVIEFLKGSGKTAHLKQRLLANKVHKIKVPEGATSVTLVASDIEIPEKKAPYVTGVKVFARKANERVFNDDGTKDTIKSPWQVVAEFEIAEGRASCDEGLAARKEM